jgi:TRAP-type uncharacterized transport system fused permease subunit
MRTGYAAVRFGWTAFIVPFLFVASPTLILIGKPWDIAEAIVTAFFGVWLVSIAVVGYFVRPLGWGSRALFAIFGLLALIPGNIMPHGGFNDLIGVGVGIVLLGYEYMHRGKAADAVKA